MFAFAGPQQLTFQHAERAETPASSCFTLIFYFRTGQIIHVFEGIFTAGFIGDGLLSEKGCKRKKQPCQRGYSHIGKCSKTERNTGF
jgi:hypothetical protein